MKLAGQVVLVTGASRGLGLAIAHALAAEGAKLACLARPGRELDEAVATLVARGMDAIAAPADVTRDAEVATAVGAVLDRWGRLDVLVLNAGTWKGAPLVETSEETWDQLMDLNAKGAFLVLRHALPAMIAARRGSVIGIASIGALVGSAGSGAYGASKFALRGLLESAALELKPHHVRVSAIYPHNINSAGRAIDPAGPERERNLEPADIAALVAHVATAPPHVAMPHLEIFPQSAAIGLR